MFELHDYDRKSQGHTGDDRPCAGLDWIGIRSLIRQLDSPTESYRQHEYDMRGISTFLLFSLKLTEETLK